MLGTVFLAAAALAAPAPEHALAVLEDGTVRVLTAGELAQGPPAATHHVWVWGAEVPPHRAAPEPWPPRQAPAPGEPLDVAIRLPRGTGPEAAVTVLAAPAAMWAEVPEPLLPRWPVPPSGTLRLPRLAGATWRLRVAGKGIGTAWVDVDPSRRHVSLRLRFATAVAIALELPDGSPPRRAALRVFPPSGPGRRNAGTLAFALADPRGVARLEAVPTDERVTIVAMSREAAPAVITGAVASLPPRLRLPRGASVTGRCTDGEGAALAGATVTVTFFPSPDLPWPMAYRATADAEGRFAVVGLPPGEVAVEARGPGGASASATATVPPGGCDLGNLELTPPGRLVLRVVDDLGRPVPGAVARVEGTAPATSDGQGLLTLDRVPTGREVTVRVSAAGHLPRNLALTAPLEEPAVARLVRAFTVTGQLLGEDGSPPGRPTVEVRIDTRFYTERIASDGSFELELPPGQPVRLRFASASTVPLELPVAPGMPGERRDLGTLTAARGFVVRGRLLRAEDGSPVAGARVWTPRPGPGGTLAAWALGDLVATESGKDGTFVLSGLELSVGELRIDAEGLARRYLSVALEPGQPVLDLGDIELVEGSTVRVTVEDDETDGAVARVNLKGGWDESDLVTEPVRDGAAALHHIGPGEILVSVVESGRLLCRETATVPEDGDEVEVTCRPRRLRVYGVVTVAGVPAGPGTLTWRTDDPLPPGIILNTRGPVGIRHQRAYTGAPPQVTVRVDDAGAFATDDLYPGTWDVTWLPADGGLSRPVRVRLPETDEFETVLEFPGGAVRGLVVDEDERPVAEASVRELTTGAFALSAPDGSFVLGGVPPGRRQVRARKGAAVSEVVPVTVGEDGRGEPVRLVVSETHAARVPVRVVDGAGAPGAGALVFLETDGGSLLFASADASGTAVLRLVPPPPSRVRAAATVGGAWAFGDWVELARAREGMILTLGPTGRLVVTSEGAAGWASLVSPGGWRLDRLLPQLGVAPAVGPDRPLVVPGLPPGPYSVALGSAYGTGRVRAGEVTTVTLGR